MKYTSNYKFKKPDPVDTRNINDINDTTDLVDAVLKKVEDKNTHLETTFNQLTINSGSSNAEIVDARVDKNNNIFPKVGDRLDHFDSQLLQNVSLGYENTSITTMKKRFESDYINVKDFGALGDGITDDTQSIKNAISYAVSVNVLKIIFPSGIYIVTETIYLDSGIQLRGNGKKKDNTIIKYIGNSGWCIATSGTFGEHRRNIIDGIGINLKSSTASGGILIGSLIDDTIIPVGHDLINVEIQDIKAGQIGIWIKNASGINMNGVQVNRGTGGTGLLISANGNNVGVFVANCCSFGGINQNDIGIEFRHGVGGLDGFTFNSCYFGGKKPILISGDSAVKNIVINSPHIETTLSDIEYYAIDVNNVIGLTINSGTLLGSANANFVGLIFRGLCSGLNITGIDANEFLNGIVYKNSYTSSPKNSVLYYASASGVNRTLTQMSGDFSTCNIIETNALRHSTIKTNSVVYNNTGNKIDYGSNTPSSDSTLITRSRGDFRFNSVPVEQGTSGSKYIILGWSNTGSGTPGTIVECRVLTGN